MHSQRVISHIYDDDAIENGIAADATSPSTTLTVRDGARIYIFALSVDCWSQFAILEEYFIYGCNL